MLDQLNRIESKIDRLLSLTRFSVLKEIEMSAQLQAVVDEVAQLPSLSDSIDKAFAAQNALLKAAIDAGADPAVLTKLHDDLDSFRSHVVAAVLANTPADPNAPTPPAPPTP